MLFKNVGYMIESSEWMYGVSVSIKEYLPNNNYRIIIQTFDPYDQCIPSFQRLDEDGDRLFNIGVVDIIDTDFNIIANNETAELIMSHPCEAYMWYHLDWVHIKYTIYKDHFEVDATPIISFKDYMNFLISTNERPYCPIYINHTDQERTPIITTGPEEYRLVYKVDDHLVLERINFGIEDMSTIKDLHYDIIPAVYSNKYKELFNKYNSDNLTRATVHTLNGTTFDIPIE